MNGHSFFYQKIKNRVSSRLLAKIRVSQMFWEPIKNRVSPRSVLLKAVYLEALLYIVGLLPVIFLGVRNNWYQSYNSIIIEIGAQKTQSGPIAWPNLRQIITFALMVEN